MRLFGSNPHDNSTSLGSYTSVRHLQSQRAKEQDDDEDMYGVHRVLMPCTRNGGSWVRFVESLGTCVYCTVLY